MICDFCSHPDPRWKYPANDFQLEDVQRLGSQGAWAACDECAALIESGDKTGLLERALHTFPLVAIVGRELAGSGIQMVHRLFFGSRTGSVQKIRIDTEY